MPPQTIIRTGFTQGVKPSLDSLVVPLNAIWKARNVRLSESGILRIRGGCRSFGNSFGTGHLQGIAHSFTDILAVHNRDLYRIDDEGDATLLLANSIGISANSMVHIEPWAMSDGKQTAYLFGGNGIYQTDGTPEGSDLVEPYEPGQGEAGNLIRSKFDGSQDIESGPAKCTQAILRPSVGIRMLATCNPDAPNTVYISEPGRADYWPDNQWFNLPEGSAKITTLALWYGSVIIFRDSDIWAYFRSDETDIDRPGAIMQEPSIGCVAARSVVAVPGLGLVFLGGPQGVADNVYVLSHVQAIENQVRATPIGDDIRKPLIDAINRYGLEGASATYYDGEYRLSIPANPGNDRVFILDLRNQTGWVTDTGPRTTQYLIKNNQLYGAVWNKGRLTRFTKDRSDEGDRIPFSLSFRREDLQPGPSRIKRLFIYAVSKGRLDDQELNWWAGMFGGSNFGEGDIDEATVVIGTEQNLDVSILVDGNVFRADKLRVRVPRTQSLLYQGVEPVHIFEARFQPSLKGHYAQVIIDGNMPNQDYAIVGYGIEFSTRGRVRASRQGVTKGA